MEYDKVEMSRASVPSKSRVKLLSLDNLESSFHLVMTDFLESETTEGMTDCPKRYLLYGYSWQDSNSLQPYFIVPVCLWKDKSDLS